MIKNHQLKNHQLKNHKLKNHKLSKHIADASWGNFVTILQYKCNWYGKELVKVNRFYPLVKDLWRLWLDKSRFNIKH